jgi:hypothetical protein
MDVVDFRKHNAHGSNQLRVAHFRNKKKTKLIKGKKINKVSSLIVNQELEGALEGILKKLGFQERKNNST